MKIKSTESVRVYRTYGGGCLMIAAIPFVVMGTVIFSSGIFVLSGSTEPKFLAIAIGMFLFGGVILSVAIPVISTRRGVTLDRVSGTATEWRNILGHQKTTAVHNLNEFDTVELSTYRPRRRTYYLVQLTVPSKKVKLCELGLLESAEEAASDASTFLSIPVSRNITEAEL